MMVAKWGNSLAIRIPKAVAEVLELAEGDQIEVRVLGPRTFEVAKRGTRRELLARLRKYRGLIPADFVFDRDEANERG